MDAHNLTNIVAVISKHAKGSSGKWSISADKISRNSRQPIKGGVKRAQSLEIPGSLYTNSRGVSGEIKTALSIKDRKRRSNSLPTEWMGVSDD